MKLRWGIIGAGGIAEKRVIPALLGSGRHTVEAIMRTDAAKLAALRQKFGIRLGCLSVEELLAQPDIDAVYIASPVYAHAGQAVACAKAGKAVFVEKPVGMSKAEVMDIRAACRSHGVFFNGALMMRHHQLHERMRRLLADGFIGTPVAARIDFHFRYPEQPGAWRQIKSLGGGGVMMDLGPHGLDTLQFVLGRRIADVKVAFMNTLTYAYEVEDSATVTLELEGGAHAVVSVHFNIPEEVSPTRLEVWGTEGRMLAEGTLGQAEAGTLRAIHASTGTQSVWEARPNGNMPPDYALYSKEFDQFQADLQAPERWEALMEEQIRLQAWLDRAYELAN